MVKVVIRKGVFETNSSSNHSLILTNKEDIVEEVEKLRIEYKWHYSYGTEEEVIETKEDKCYLLAGVFEEVLERDCCDIALYNIFKQVLKDNNETLILAEVEKHMVNYHENNYALFCEDYFCHGVLCDCNCNFLSLLGDFFDVDLSFYLFGIKLDNEYVKESEKLIYDMFYKYIYSGVVVVPYEYM